MSRKNIEDRIKFYNVLIMLCKEIILKKADNAEDKVRTIDTYTDIIANSKLEIRRLEYKLMNIYGIDVRNNA